MFTRCTFVLILIMVISFIITRLRILWIFWRLSSIRLPLLSQGAGRGLTEPNSMQNLVGRVLAIAATFAVLCSIIGSMQTSPLRTSKTVLIIASPAFTLRFKNSFFPYSKNHWDLLPADVRSIPSFGKFKSNLIKSVRPSPSSNYGVTDIFGLKLLTQLRVDLNDLRVHRLRHGFLQLP